MSKRKRTAKIDSEEMAAGGGLPVKTRLIRDNNQWVMETTPTD
ncbi:MULTISPECIES: hypothetical protein [Bacillus cereus group]|nr:MULTISPECIES: hypothetical protein [Bacillus cereus group]